MANFLVLVVFALIGSIFGPIGFLIGMGLGICVWRQSGKKGNSDANELESRNMSLWLAAMKSHGASASFIASKKGEYQTLVAQMYAYILYFFSGNGTPKVDAVTGLLRNDDWISDKFAALEAISNQIPGLLSQRHDLPLLFQLQSNALLERMLLLPKQMKNRLAMQLDSVWTELSEDDPEECRKLIDKLRSALRQDAPASALRLAAEEVITQSGDTQAIDTLQVMRSKPSQYRSLLKSGAAGNPVLRTAFGVFAGMLTADAVKAAIANAQMSDLVSQLDQEIEGAGGLNNIPLEDKELEDMEASESVEQGADLAESTGLATWGEGDAAPGTGVAEPSGLSADDQSKAGSDALDGVDGRVDVADSAGEGLWDIFRG